jgi:predicted acylesterase/phospholipase RssA
MTPPPSPPPERTGRTALCLCGGGITGAVYELGVLTALNRFFVDFDTSRFDMYLGTSAGALMVTMMAAGLKPDEIARSIMDPKADEAFMPVSRSNIYKIEPREIAKIVRDVTVILGRFLARSARRRELHVRELSMDLEDALPAGIFSLEHYEGWLTRTFEQRGIPTRFTGLTRELFITANDLDSGHRAVFGEEHLRDVSIPRAICASSAIPGFFQPVEIGGRDYVDGAVGKVAHLDVVLRRGAELLVVVNPMIPVNNQGGELPSALLGVHRMRDKGLLAVFDQARRMNVRTKLYQGLKRYRLQYPQATILLIEPQEVDADMMLANPMNFAVRRRLLRYGYDSAARSLQARHSEFAEACARHRIQIDPGRLSDRPWELT